MNDLETLMNDVDMGAPDDWLSIEVLDPESLALLPSPLKRLRRTDAFLIAYTAAGEPRVISARCPHRQLPLAEFGRPGRKPGTIVCTAHQCEFDVETGQYVASPSVREDVSPLPSWRLVRAGDGSWRINPTFEEQR